MNALLLGSVVGLATGIFVTWCIARFTAKRRQVKAAALVADIDQPATTARLEAHTAAVTRQVGRYADVLAGDDVVLRERLHHFERGGA